VTLPESDHPSRRNGSIRPQPGRSDYGLFFFRASLSGGVQSHHLRHEECSWKNGRLQALGPGASAAAEALGLPHVLLALIAVAPAGGSTQLLERPEDGTGRTLERPGALRPRLAGYAPWHCCAQPQLAGDRPSGLQLRCPPPFQLPLWGRLQLGGSGLDLGPPPPN